MGKAKKKSCFFMTTDEASTCQFVNTKSIVRLYVGENDEPYFKFSAYAELTTGSIVDLNCFDTKEDAFNWLKKFTRKYFGNVNVYSECFDGSALIDETCK